MQTKTTRAFRTISEAGDELGLQPHVLRFWESKFPQIKPIKRGGGRRFYRPEDIEFLRGIKKLLHDESHPIKDVQKLIRVKGANRIVELGRSVEKAARDKDITDTVLVPERIKKEKPKPKLSKPKAKPSIFRRDPKPDAASVPEPIQAAKAPPQPPEAYDFSPAEQGLSEQERQSLESALERLINLRARWQEFKAGTAAENAAE